MTALRSYIGFLSYFLNGKGVIPALFSTYFLFISYYLLTDGANCNLLQDTIYVFYLFIIAVEFRRETVRWFVQKNKFDEYINIQVTFVYDYVGFVYVGYLIFNYWFMELDFFMMVVTWCRIALYFLMEFDMVGVDPSLATAFRRILIAEVSFLYTSAFYM